MSALFRSCRTSRLTCRCSLSSRFVANLLISSTRVGILRPLRKLSFRECLRYFDGTTCLYIYLFVYFLHNSITGSRIMWLLGIIFLSANMYFYTVRSKKLKSIPRITNIKETCWAKRTIL